VFQTAWCLLLEEAYFFISHVGFTLFPEKFIKLGIFFPRGYGYVHCFPIGPCPPAVHPRPLVRARGFGVQADGLPQWWARYRPIPPFSVLSRHRASLFCA